MKNGFIVFDKPLGARSTFCVERVRRALGRDVKVGHGGTLDSSATGVLVILVGGATRLSSIVMDMGKTYRAKIQLGSETTTCDSTGEVSAEADFSHVDDAMIDTALYRFLGWIEQIPPKVSAVHVDGRRSHDIFRSGGDPQLKPRLVYVSYICRTGALGSDGSFELLVRCGKGAYIRSLARDIGRAVGTHAHIAFLRRESVGCFSSNGAIVPPDDMELDPDVLTGALLPLDSLAACMPYYIAHAEQSDKLANGSRVPLQMLRRRSACCAAAAGGRIIVGSHSHTTVCGVKQEGAVTYAVPEINVRGCAK